MIVDYNDVVNKVNKLLHLTEFSNEIDPATFYFKKNTIENLTHGERTMQKLLVDERVFYNLNNYAHRSEDFVFLDQTKNNMLFSGCSSTFGIGLPEKYIWTKQLYHDLPIKNKGSFQSLGSPGASAERIISNIFKYCNKFGNPKYIFIAFQDYTREIRYVESEGRFTNHINVNYETLSLDIEEGYDVYLIFKFQLLYRMLEAYCNSNNIILISTSWDTPTANILSKIFPKSFINLDIDLNKYIENFNIDAIDILDRDFLSVGRDGHHPGIIEQKMMADLFIQNFKQLTT